MESRDFNALEQSLECALFAILDCETTGFSPARGDKIIEIAIITCDLSGNICDQYETLINPNREIDACSIHHITSEMVFNAPSIQDVMEDILFHLNGKTIIGHNVAFDLRFINFELSKYFNKSINLRGGCTMELAGIVEPSIPSRKLKSICEYFNIPIYNEHTAIGDCMAAYKVFNLLCPILIERSDFETFLNNTCKPVEFIPEPAPKGISFKRDHARAHLTREADKIRDMLQRLPNNPTDAVPVQNYLSLLDRILSDRIISDDETQVLLEFINEYGLSRDQVDEIHHEYIRKLIRIYLLDGIISEGEHTDLQKVCVLLSIEINDLNKLIEFEKAEISKEVINQSPVNENKLVGKSVCFTGQLISTCQGQAIDRSFAHRLSHERGLIVKKDVSKDLDYLIVADPYSLSGKSRKARGLGIPILEERVFWNMINFKVD